MTLARRLAAVEESLSTTQLVLAWLAEAHAFGSVAAYVASLVESDPPVTPLDRLARAAARSARKVASRQRREVVEATVRSAVLETAFRYELVVRINTVAYETLQREALMATVLAARVALETSQMKRGSNAGPHLGHMIGLLAAQRRELQAVAEARTIAEQRYFDGQGALFPGVAAAWETQVQHCSAIAGAAASLVVPEGAGASRQADPEHLGRRGADRLADLVEPARATALAKTGEARRALGVSATRLRERIARTGTADDAKP